MDISVDGICVAVCTFKRPDGLARLLRSLTEGFSGVYPKPTVIVVDNDGKDPAVATVVDQIKTETALDIRLFVERQPGISAARNRCIAQALEIECSQIAMLDDDEWPADGWLKSLVVAQRASGACVVGGIVEPVFPDGQQDLKKYGRFWAVAPQQRTGLDFIHATSNVLIDLSQLSDLDPPYFDDAYGLTGGGDLVFFSRLFDLGKKMMWETNALAFEEIPEKRANWDWMKRRRFRVGNHMVMEEQISKGRLKTLLKTFGLTIRLLCYPLLRREPNCAMVGWWLEKIKIQGRYFAHFGMRSVEYARDGSHMRKASDFETSGRA